MFAGVAAYMYWGMGFKKAPMLMIFWMVPALAILINFISLRSNLAKLKARPSPLQPGTVHTNLNFVIKNTSATMQAFPATARDEALLRAPAPREIRVSKSGRLIMWIASLGLLVFFVPFAAGVYRQWALYRSFSNVSGLAWGIAIESFVALAAFGMWRGQVRECDLLKHGEAAMGRVLRQWTDDKRNSSVEYEFTDFLGSSHKGSAFDRTNQLFSGMPVVVFYDRDNPKRQIAYCATLHEVILPSTVVPVREEMLTKQ